MERLQIFVDDKTKKVIDRKRGNVPLSIFLRKDLENRYK